MIISRFTAAAFAAGITGALLTGCASSSAPEAASVPQVATTAAPAVFVAQAAETTRSAGSARITSTATIGSGGESTTIRADGVADFVGNEAALRVSSSLFGGSADMQVILVGGKSYIQVPIFGEKWISMPLQDLGVNLADPSQGLDMLKQVADLQEIGQEPLDGIEATKFVGTVDLADAVGSGVLPVPDRAATKKLSEVAGTADVEVWVDDEGRIVRFDQSADISTGSGPDMTVTSSTSLTDFGIETQIEAPPADQVMDGEALSGLSGLDSQPR